MAFPPKKPAGPADPEMDAIGALMSEGGDEEAEGAPEKPAAGGDPEAVITDLQTQLEQLRALIAGG